MHKKGITEEVAKKRSRRTVKHQRGIVGADLAAIAAKRNQTAAQRASARATAITKAKSDKKDKESKKEKTKVRVASVSATEEGRLTLLIGAPDACCRAQGLQAAGEGRQGWSVNSRLVVPSVLSIRLYTTVSWNPFRPCTHTHPSSARSAQDIRVLIKGYQVCTTKRRRGRKLYGYTKPMPTFESKKAFFYMPRHPELPYAHVCLISDET